MKNLFKIGDKVKWGKRKEVYEVVDKWNAGDSIGYYIHKGNDDTSTIVSPSELTKVPNKVTLKEQASSASFVGSKKDLEKWNRKYYGSPKRTVKKESCACGGTLKGSRFSHSNKDCHWITDEEIDDIFSTPPEIDIPTNLRKVETYENVAVGESVKDNWPNGYTLAFVLAGILFVIAYCVGMARI